MSAPPGAVPPGPRPPGPALPDWLGHAADALGVDISDLDERVLLDLTRDVAHQVARPAAPLTLLLVGLAAGAAGGGASRIATAAAITRGALRDYAATRSTPRD